MPHSSLSVTLATLLAVGPAAPQSQALLPPLDRFAKRLTEHGPLRRSLEATLDSPITQSSAAALDVSLDQVRSDLGVPSRHATASQVAQQGPSGGSTNYLKTLLFVGILLAVAVIGLAISLSGDSS